VKIDKVRIKKCLYDILSNLRDIESLLEKYKEKDIISNKHFLKSLKYSLVEMSEASSIILQHILAKHYGMPVKGYMDTIKKAAEVSIISAKLYSSLKPFFELRNAIVHRYWSIDDKKLLKLCKRGYKNFYSFIENIESFIRGLGIKD